MCSIEEPVILDSRSSLTSKETCVKCKVAKGVLIVRHAQYCKECFMLTSNQKFKSTLSKMRSVCTAKKVKVLAAFSGGPSSRAMLHFLHLFQQGSNGYDQKFTSITVVHIDHSILFPENTEQQKELNENLRAIVQTYGFSFISIPIENIFQSTTDKSTKSRFKEELANFKTATAKEDYLHHLRQQCLSFIAESINCSLVFTGENATRLACRVISYTSKGRGYTLPIDTAVECLTRDGIYFLKPMREFLSKDIAFINQFHHLESIFIPELTTKASPKATIDKLTEEFVVGLQHDYPSTVTTIMRTVSKLAPVHDSKRDQLCALCKCPFPQNCSENGDPLSIYCYGCSIIAKESFNNNPKTSTRSSVESLRSQIADFLLE